MQFRAHDYQQLAVNFIESHPEAALFLDCGLGKTVITLTALQSLLNDSFAVRRVLIIAPLRVARDTWPQELRKWDHLTGLTYAVAVGTGEEREHALKQNTQLTIINRENVPWLIKNHPWKWDMVVIDELSSFKNNQALRFKALKAVRAKIDRIVGLTGTPTPNGLMDLWAPFRLLDDGERLGKYITHYRNEYFTPGKTSGHVVYNWKLKPKAADRIYQAISDITISMQALNHLKMPNLLLQTVEVELTEDERECYDTLKDDLVMPGTDFVAGSAAVLVNKLAQLANGCFYLDDGKLLDFHQHKLDALEDLIETMQGQPLLVAYWFKFDLDRIKSRFPEARELKSSRDFSDWNARKIPVGLIHPASAGHGLNLQQGGNVLAWFGLTWSLEFYQQTNARLYRQGQSARTVVIKHIIAKGTIDEKIMHALSTKAVTQENLVEAVRAQF